MAVKLRRGLFVTFEGVEGVGKSTQLALAAEHLRSRGIEPVLTREPGGTPLAERLRELVLVRREEPVDPATELLAVFAARAHHVAHVIRPALRLRRVVLCDRFTDATEAYQGGGRGLNRGWIRQLARVAHPRLMPDLTLLLDAGPGVARTRLARRGAAPDRFESEDEEFFGRVREAYLAIARREPERVRVIDAAGTEAEVAARIAAEIDRLVGAARP